jgi:hypothetical protein
MENLGHSSKAVDRAYAKNGEAVVPALDDFERRMAEQKLIKNPFISSSVLAQGQKATNFFE